MCNAYFNWESINTRHTCTVTRQLLAGGYGRAASLDDREHADRRVDVIKIEEGTRSLVMQLGLACFRIMLG